MIPDNIIQKENPMRSIIEDYKKHISQTELKDEIYKWELVNEYRGRPNTDAEDFYQEVKDIKFSNLMYHLGITVLYQLAEDKPEELRQLFIHLYDENKNLTERVKSFNKDTFKIYRNSGETKQHHQDERSVATYLTFHNPDKYTFYKYSFYNKYCAFLGIKEATKNEKYTHYLSLIDELIEKHIKTDTELIEQVKSFIPDFYDGTNHKLLAQDILFQMLDRKPEANYWIFQGSPKLFDFETALKEELLTDWNVVSHKDKIKRGDKVILWFTGDKSGCYALAEITSEPHIKDDSSDDHLWKEENKNELKVGIRIIHNLVDEPILKERIDSFEKLQNLKVGHQGTNFSATKEEYQTILNLIEVKGIFQETKTKFDPFVFNNFIQFLRKIHSELNLPPNDDRIVYTVLDNKLNFIIGQRYCFNLYLNNSKGIYGVISKDKLLESSELYDGTPPQPYYSYYTEFDPSTDEWDSIIEGIKDELNRTAKSGYRKYNNSDFEKYVFQLSGETNTNDNMNLSLNTILYGPPGTGKTYTLKNKYMDFFTSPENSITKEDFLKDIIQNSSWWQVIALAVLELGKTKVTDIHNHEYVQIKANLSNSTTVRPTIWSQLQSHTIEECEHVGLKLRTPPFIFNKTEDSEWEILINEVKEQSPEILELTSKIDNFENIPHKKIERFEFITFHQSYAYEDFIEGIKPELSEGDVAYTIEEGVFQKLCNRARNDLSNNYALFIDEINRGNISSIFGELITLIEDDKREGEQNEIKATLPYSKKRFSVPNNLYIIGTMNTADRSVEALDTALRRRFSFIEMNPEPAKLNSAEFECKGIDLEALLTAINGRIEKLLDKDYCIGHSYFMTIKNHQEPLEEIKFIFQNKVLPLLQEYFYGDWGKIRLIIGKEFVEIKRNTIQFLSTDNYEDFEEYDEKPIYNFTSPSNWTLGSFQSIYE